LHHHSAVKFLSSANLIKELHVRNNRALKQLQFGTEDEGSAETIYCDRILLAISNHPNVKVLDTKCGTVSTTCLAELGKCRWWSKLRKISMKLGPNKNPLARAGMIFAMDVLAKSRTLSHVDIKVPAKYFLPIALSCKNLVSSFHSLLLVVTILQSLTVLNKNESFFKETV
jgi:hypothetical protein